MNCCTNNYGFTCEEMIRDLLPEIGFPHTREARRNGYWWANRYEDLHLGVDCWLTMESVEYPVDFTIISNEELIPQKTKKAIERGVIPVFLSQRTISKAKEGREYALRELEGEIRCQVALKKGMVKNNMLVRIAPVPARRELAAVC